MERAKVTEKTCCDCGKTKKVSPNQKLSSFYVKEKRKYATRYFSRCKKCYYKWVYGRDKVNGHRWHGPKQKNGQARRELHLAIRRGDVVKPKLCQKCGKKSPKKELHGHHHNGYANPLDVAWLCRECHHAAHAA